jgi:hypothetical protein
MDTRPARVEGARRIRTFPCYETTGILGLEPVSNTPDECAAQFRAAEMAKWAKVIRG